MRTAARKDAVQASIVQALRNAGLVVMILNGPGLPDLLTYHPERKRWMPLEVKGARGVLTRKQAPLHALTEYPIARSVLEALNVLT